MEKRALLAIILSFIVLYIFQAYFLPPPPPQQNQSKEVKRAEQGEKINRISKIHAKKAVSEKLSLNISSEVERAVHVENEDVKGEVFSPGGGFRNLYLKKYRVSVEKNSPPVRLIGPYGSFLFEADVNGKKFINFPFSITSGGRRVSLIYSGSFLTVTEGVSYGKEGYTFDVYYGYTNRLTRPVDLKLVIYLQYPVTGESSRYFFRGPVVDFEESLKKIKEKEIKKKGRVIYSGDVKWAGFTDRYFLQAVVTDGMNPEVEITGNDRIYRMRVIIFDRPVDPGVKVVKKVKIYTGPKKLSILKDAGGDLHRAVDFGIWGIIARPTLALLNLFNLIFHNYGWSIILLTILIKILFYPLTLKSYQSMAKLKELQPLMEEIKQKYADNREKMNQELMELYRKYKVNPMGGCLPTLIQIPIFIALYYVLLRSIELRHAHFLLWIKDLSAPETLFTIALGSFHLPIRVLPILMGVTMYLQQKLSPTGMDKSQQMIFTLLPLIFTVLFYGLPSGLMLYWSTNNIISIYQQLRINKFLENGKKEKVSKKKK